MVEINEVAILELAKLRMSNKEEYSKLWHQMCVVRNRFLRLAEKGAIQIDDKDDDESKDDEAEKDEE